MKKITLATLAAMVLVGTNATAYELVTSVYYPTFGTIKYGKLISLSQRDYSMPWLYAMDNEIAETGYAKNYLNPTFIAGIADAFDRQLESDDKAVRMNFSKRTLSAVLGFHKKAVEMGEESSWMGLVGEDTDYNRRASNMIDFITIPMLSKIANNKETLNDYSTRLRKEAIDRAPGKVWAGGATSVSFEARDYRFGHDSHGGENGRYVSFPAKVEGVQYNSFVSELLTIFQEARKLNVEMDVLAQVEKVATMKHAEIEFAVKEANTVHANKDDSKTHKIWECYGYLDSQKAVLLQAAVLAKDDISKAKEFMTQIEKQHRASIRPRTPEHHFYSTGIQDPNAHAANIIVANPPVVKYRWAECHLPAMKQLAPGAFGNQDSKASDEALWKKALLSPLRLGAVAVEECQSLGLCER